MKNHRMIITLLALLPACAMAAENTSVAGSLGKTIGLVLFGYFVLRWVNGRNK